MNLLSTKNDKEINSLKIHELFHFKKCSDEFFYKNIDNYEELIAQNLKICFDPYCTNLRCKNICFIYTNPKVGCTSLWSSLNLHFSEFLTAFRWHNEYPLEGKKMHDITINQIIGILNAYDKNVIVIDIFRPIFDMVRSYFFLYFISIVDEPHRHDIDYIMYKFNECFLYLYNHINVDYFREIYKLNATFNEFDFNKKHLFFRNTNVKYIKLRLIDSNEWSNILSFVFNGNLQIIPDNQTENKEFGEMYKEFKQKYKIPKNYYELIKKNEHFLFYYTPEEQQTYLKQFEGKVLNHEYTPPENISIFPTIPKEISEEEKKKYARVLHEINKANEPVVSNCTCDICKAKKNELLSKNI